MRNLKPLDLKLVMLYGLINKEKGYEQNWRRELFTVYEIVQRIPIVYRFKDLQGEEIKGTYYEADLQKVVDSGFYPVENVIKEKDEELLNILLNF
ncbi:chromo domain-containing protein [Trichonephila clavipes]|uniref:Chromo domain-containing protein n=1 Tax=Trichonephila clavipes TaxID=2585209 RepID=A0A8X6V1N5_TRICX|nr:chromo domain-containing protein [Trichonephila clavipes]